MPSAEPWYRSKWFLWLMALLVPPVGLFLLWTRPRLGVVGKLLGTLVVAVLAFAHLAIFWGLRVELDGSGQGVLVSWGSQRRHFAALESHRATQAPAPAARAASETEGPSWPHFRGPHYDGIADTPVRTDWPAEGLPELWRQPVGGGYASFAVGAGMAITIEQRREQEVVVAYDLRSGGELWSHGWVASFEEAMGGDGPRSSPVWDEERIYALGATGELRALTARDGTLLWSTNILADARAENLPWGMAVTPLIVGDQLIVLPGGPNASVVSYDKHSGERLWAVESDMQAYVSPLLVTLAGQEQLLVVSGERAMGLALDGGRLLWSYPWVVPFDTSAAQPVVIGTDGVFLSAGNDHGSVLLQIRRDGDAFVAEERWRNRNMKNSFSSSVLKDGYLYGLDNGILAAIDAQTGERAWKGGRYGHGQLLLAKDHLVVLTERGDLALVAAEPTAFQELAKVPAIKGKTWNYPALAGDVLLVRNANEMAAFDVGAGG